MVPFNVVETRNGSQRPRFHRATSGTMLIAPSVPGLRDALDVPGVTLAEHPDMTGVMWGKLILNLNNALNALAGIPLAVELADRRWRVVLAAQIEEALAVLNAARIRPAGVEGVPPRVIPLILRLPDWLFRLVARSMSPSIPPRAPPCGGLPRAAQPRSTTAGRHPGAGEQGRRGDAHDATHNSSHQGSESPAPPGLQPSQVVGAQA
jgi:hypothetical protein